MKLKLPKRPANPRGSESIGRTSRIEDSDFDFGQFANDDSFTPKRKSSNQRKIEMPQIQLPKIDLSKIRLPKNTNAKSLLYALFALVIAITLAVAIIPSMVENYRAEKEAEAKRNDPIAKLPSIDALVPTVPDYTYKYYKHESSALYDYEGEIEYVTVGPIIADTREAFDKDEYEAELDDIALTAKEFRAFLQNLYDRGYILVDINDLWAETTSADGSPKMDETNLRLPKDKKPIVLFFTHTNFTTQLDSNGFPKKLIVGPDGEIWTNDTSSSDNVDIAQDSSGITILDQFVEENPSFSLNGAKGCIVVNGSEGIFGYATAKAADNDAEKELLRRRETANLMPVIQRLKDTGWYFGCNTYTNLNLSQATSSQVIADITKWVEEVGLLVGRTNIFLAPGDSQLDGEHMNQTGEAFEYLQSLGFRIFVSAGTRSLSRVKTDISALCCSSMRLDGMALKWSSSLYAHLFDIYQVFDFDNRPNYGRNFAGSGTVIGPEPGTIPPEPGTTTDPGAQGNT